MALLGPPLLVQLEVLLELLEELHLHKLCPLPASLMNQCQIMPNELANG